MNEVEIKATSLQTPGNEGVIRTNFNVTAQGTTIIFTYASTSDRTINILIACSFLKIDHPICSPSVDGSNFTFTFKANKPVTGYSCSLNNKQRTCSKVIVDKL